jgi:glycosyltransferase involved in cell wall biosynthesis
VRILIVHSRYRSGPASGENQVVSDEVRLLEEAGHDVAVLDPVSEDERGLQLLRAAKDVVWSSGSARDVRNLLRFHSPDVVHYHNVLTGLSPTVLRAAQKEKIPAVMTLHNYRLMCLPGTFLRAGHACELCSGKVPWPGVRFSCYRGSKGASGVLATSLVLHRRIGSFEAIDRYLAVSDFLRSKHIEGGVQPERIEVKPNFTWRVPKTEGVGDYFLFLGRLAPEKGVDTLMDAWKGLSETKLLVAGDGPNRQELRQKAPSSVEFLGTVHHEEVSSLLAGARALLVPSIWYEGAPRSILEAYSAGVPVLASRIGALPEVVDDHVSGHLVPPGDAGAWRDAIEMMSDPALAKRLGEGALSIYERLYTPEEGLARLERVYAEVIGDRN